MYLLFIDTICIFKYFIFKYKIGHSIIFRTHRVLIYESYVIKLFKLSKFVRKPFILTTSRFSIPPQEGTVS